MSKSKLLLLLGLEVLCAVPIFIGAIYGELSLWLCFAYIWVGVLSYAQGLISGIES